MKKNIYKKCHCEGAAKRARLRAKARQGRASLIADEAISLNNGIAALVCQLTDSLAMTFRGQMLVELLLVIGLSAIIFPALLTGFIASREGKPQQKQRMLATTLIKETEQAAISVRDVDWTLFATFSATPLHPVISGGRWALVPGAETINDLTRQIVISDVYRDANGAIATSGGTLDPSTKKITSAVSWTRPFASSLNSVIYLTRTQNLSKTWTSQADFQTEGTFIGTTATNYNGGEIELSAGNADWCSPQDYIINQINLPKLSNSIYAATGSAYLGAGDGTSSPMFINITINTPPLPASPSASIAGTYNGTYVTNAIFSDGNYVYLATTNPAAQVVVLDITHSPYTAVGTVTIPGGNPANGVYVVGDILFVTSGNKLYTYNIANKIGSHTTPLTSKAMWFGFFATNPTARQVMVVNNRAYVGTGNTWLGVQVFSVSANGSTITFKGSAGLTYNQQSQGLYVNSTGSRVYVAFNNGDGGFSKGFFIINTSVDPPWWWPFYGTVGQYNAGSTDPRGMVVVPGDNRAIIVGIGGIQQYQVINISNESNPILCGGLPKAGDPVITGGVVGVSALKDQNGNAFSYIITGEAGNQFKIIQGGNGGSTYASSGTFESSTFDAGYQAVFNSFVTNFIIPSQTSLQMQIAAAAPIADSCNSVSFTFVGPNGNQTAYYTPTGSTISAQIPLGNYSPYYENPGRCFRYKAWLSTSDSAHTPILNDMNINYSP